MPEREFDGKTVIITGAGTGIGRDMAARFATAGGQVVVTGRRQELLDTLAAEIDASGGEALVVAGDVSSEAHVETLFASAADRFGPVDVLINNAAIAGEVGNIWELSREGFEEALRINLTGPWLCSRAAAKQMMPRRAGKILNIGSISGKRPLATRTPYTTSKMGLIGMTRTLAVELGEFDINVNLISPGATETERLVHLAEQWERDYDELVADFGKLSPLKRIVQPQDISELALFLASDRARNITGFDINCDAGLWPV